MHLRASLLFVALLLCACGLSSSDPASGAGATGTGGGGATGGDGGTGGVDIPPGAETFVVTFDPVTVPSGSEDTRCVVKRLGNDVPIHVHQIHNELPAGSHHLIVYRTADTEEQPEPFACQPFTDTLDPSKGSPLMVTQKHDDLLVLPDGVGFTLAAGVMVRLEMHYINATAAPLDVSAKSTFITMPDADFEDEADFLFIGSPDIDIPAMGSQTLGPVYFPLGTENPALAGVKFFGITGHTHQWGTNVRVETAASESAQGTAVYDVPNWQWSEPATVTHDPPFEVPAGGGFKFTCSWNNLSTQSVGFGESANAEMCFFWAYYYPSKGSFVCAHTDQVAGGYDLCCPGDLACSQLF